MITAIIISVIVGFWFGFFLRGLFMLGKDRPIFPATENIVENLEDLTTMDWNGFKQTENLPKLTPYIEPKEGKTDKETASFDRLYIGHDRRRTLHVNIESLKLNGVDYTDRVKQPLFRGVDRRKQKDEVDAAVYQPLEDNNE